MNSIGVLWPIELCGRSVLYSCLNASHFNLASASDKNQFWSMHSARTFPLKASTKLLSVGLGWALPAALGAKLAYRERSVIAGVGDGSYMFANPVACHQTAAIHGLPILTVIFNNTVWNAVRRATKSMYPQGRAAAANTIAITSLGHPPDYAAIAGAHGAFAEKVEDADALPDAIARALKATREEGRQALLDVTVSY